MFSEAHSQIKIACQQCRKQFRANRYIKAHIKLVHINTLKCLCDIYVD